MSTLAIVGSRSLEHDKDAREFAHNLVCAWSPLFDRFISGGARGVDGWAKLWATELKKDFTEYPVTPAMYDALGKRAPLSRNERIARECDEMVAFWDGKSRGTIHAVRSARNEGKRWRCLRWDGYIYHAVDDIPVLRRNA